MPRLCARPGAVDTFRMRLILDETIRVDDRSRMPESAEGEALVRITSAPIDCWDLRRAGGPRVPGRFGIGVCERSDDGDLVGVRVMIRPVISCGRCDLCLKGLREHCRDRQILGEPAREGCFQRWVSVPVENLVRVPENLSDEAAAMAPLVARAIHAARRIRVDARPFVTIVGDDAQALICAQHMSRLNAAVRIVGEQRRRFELCERWGVRHRHADEVGRRADQDIVLISSGVEHACELALGLIRPRGRLVLLASAIASGRLEGLEPERIIEREIEVVGVDQGPLDEALDLLMRGQIEVDSLMERRLLLRDGPVAYELARSPASLQVLLGAA